MTFSCRNSWEHFDIGQHCEGLRIYRVDLRHKFEMVNAIYLWAKSKICNLK